MRHVSTKLTLCEHEQCIARVVGAHIPSELPTTHAHRRRDKFPETSKKISVGGSKRSEKGEKSDKRSSHRNAAKLGELSDGVSGALTGNGAKVVSTMLLLPLSREY